MIQKIVKSETSELTSKLFGSFDSNVKALESAFGVNIQNRSAESGDAILVSGEEDSVNNATKAVEFLKRDNVAIRAIFHAFCHAKSYSE